MSNNKKPFLDIDAVTGMGDRESSQRPPAKPKTVMSPAVSLGSGDSKANNILDLIDAKDQSLKEKDVELEALRQELEKAKGEGRAELTLTMPVSGLMVTFHLEEVPNELIVVSEENERDQSLLDKAAVADILLSIEKDGQQKPGTLRPIGNGRYELIEGSRRLACCRFIDRPYLAFVGDVPDADVRALSRIENKHNQISIYEKALSYLKDIGTKYKNWEQLSAAEGFSSRQATRYRRMAELDKTFVRAFPNPSELAVTIADWLTQKIEANEENKTKLLDCARGLVADRILRIEKGEELLGAEEISKRLKQAIRVTTEQPSVKKPLVYKSVCGKIEVKHSITNKGTRKLELVGVTDSKMEALLDFVKKKFEVV